LENETLISLLRETHHNPDLHEGQTHQKNITVVCVSAMLLIRNKWAIAQCPLTTHSRHGIESLHNVSHHRYAASVSHVIDWPPGIAEDRATMSLWEKLQKLFGISRSSHARSATSKQKSRRSERNTTAVKAKQNKRKAAIHPTSKQKSPASERNSTVVKARPNKRKAGRLATKQKATAPERDTTAAKTGPKRLDATSETALSNALRALEPGQKGWISFDDCARLFSPTGEHPSEWDEAGLRALGEFAAQLQHRSTPERDTVQQRILFTRIRTLTA
jgi:hypothetical protein